MNEPIRIDDKTNALIEHILQVSDSANGSPYPAFSREDVVAIGVKLFQLACMSPLMCDPAVVLWHTASKSWLEQKGGNDHEA